MRFSDKVRNFMYGRYGRDQLNLFIMAVCLVMLVIGMFAGGRASRVLLVLALILLAVSYYRMFSRNYAKRAEENSRFLAIKNRLFKSFSRKKAQIQDKEHAYYKCPNCKKQLRVPKGKGTISIHCPQCGTDFIEKT